MTRTISTKRFFISFGTPLLLLCILFLIGSNQYVDTSSKPLSLAITLDLLLTVPIIYYMIIRKTAIPNTSVVPLMIIGLILGYIILPSGNHQYLNLFKTWILPIIELSIITYVVIKIRKTLRYFKTQKQTETDFFSALKTTTKELFPSTVASLVTMEIAIFYYGFVHWSKSNLKENEFSYHKKSDTKTLVIGVFVAILAEAIVLHMLLLKWSPIAAWIFTGLSLYSAIQIFGLLKSVLKRPIIITNNTLYLRYGIINEAEICLDNIDAIEWTKRSIEFNSEIRALSIIENMEGHNVVIHLKTKDILNGLYGSKKTFKSIAFTIDNEAAFRNLLDASMI